MLSPASAAERQQSIRVILAFLAIYTIWGTTYLFIAIAVESIPPFLMAGARFLIAGSLTLLFLRLRGVPIPNRFQWRAAAVVGGFMLMGGNGFVTWSEQRIPSGIAAVVVATVPLWVTLFDWLIFKAVAPSRRIVLGLLLGLAGITLLIGPTDLREAAGFSLFDMLILLMAPVLWAFGSLRSRRANLPSNVFMATAAEMISGGLILLVAGLLTSEMADFNLAVVTTRSFISMLYLAFFGSIVALTAYVWLLKSVEAVKVASYAYVNPVIAVFLGWLILDENLTPQMMVAMAIIIVAVVLITTRRSEPRELGPAPECAAPVGVADSSTK